MSKIKHNIVANYVGQGWAALMMFAFIPVYIKHLGMEAYGLIGLLSVTLAWFTLLDMGISPTLTREMARFTAGQHTITSIHALLRSLELLYLGIALAIIVSFSAASPLIARHWLHVATLSTSSVVGALCTMSIVVALRFLEAIYRGSLFGLQRQILYNGINTFIMTLRQGGAAVIVVWVSPTIEAFFVWQGCISLLSVILMGWSVHRSLPTPPGPPKFSREAVLGVWRFASGMMGITFLATLLTQVDKLLLSRLLSLDAFGSYMLATSVTGTLAMIVAPVSQALYPRFVELASSRDEPALASLYHRGAQLVTVATAPAALVLSLHARGILYMWSANPDVSARSGPIVAILVIGSFLNCLMYLPYQLQLAFGWTRLGIQTNAMAVALLIPAVLWIAPRYGGVGTASIWVVLNLGYVLGSVQWMHTRLLPNEKNAWYSQDVLVPLLASVGVAALLYPLRPDAVASRWHWLAYALLLGGLMTARAALAASRLRPTIFHAARVLRDRMGEPRSA